MSNYYKNNNRCVDCGILIDDRAKRCPKCYHKNKIGKSTNHKSNCNCCSCRAKRGEYKGKNNPCYKKGKPKCIDCGKKLNGYRAKRCKVCSNESKNNPAYIDGRTLKKYYCKVEGCKNEINFHSFLYGKGICKFCASKGINNGRYIDNRTSKKYYCIEGCGNEISYTNWWNGKKRCGSCSKIEIWKNLEYKNKTLKAQRKAMQLTPNIPERKLRKLLNQLFPKEYKFVGDGKVWINGFNPDFINCNGKKKIIEFNGLYWHTKDKYVIQKDKRKLREYKKLGYSTLIIWDNELRNIDKLINKILKFNGEKLCKQK